MKLTFKWRTRFSKFKGRGRGRCDTVTLTREVATALHYLEEEYFPTKHKLGQPGLVYIDVGQYKELHVSQDDKGIVEVVLVNSKKAYDQSEPLKEAGWERIFEMSAYKGNKHDGWRILQAAKASEYWHHQGRGLWKSTQGEYLSSSWEADRMIDDMASSHWNSAKYPT